MTRSKSQLRSVWPWRSIAVWLIGMLIVTAGLFWREWGQAVARFERDAGNLHRLVAQRIDQHDAHMTGLSALLAASDPPPVEAIRAVSVNILQFYPRITAIDIIRLDSTASSIFTTRPAADAAPFAGIAQPALAGTGAVTVPRPASRYWIVKRMPQSASLSSVLVLEIDARRLLDVGSQGAIDVALTTAMVGDVVFKSQLWSDAVPSRSVRLETVRQASSQSQPFDLRLRRDMAISSLLPIYALVLTAATLAGVLWLLRIAVEARRSAVAAAALAEVSAQEARMAKATRINAMGELSLGIAHELTQPLAALLAQSQAGLRMVKSGATDSAAIVGVLEANARHAKRAGDLLAKLRSWVAPGPVALKATNIDEAIAGLIALNMREFRRDNIRLVHSTAKGACIAAADSMSIEQIAQNLIANARDACRHAAPRGSVVTVAVFAEDDRTGFSVTDDGDGISDQVASRLFEPFTTTKSDGMGLGLSICRRLVEQFGGTIVANGRSDGQRGTVFTVALPAFKAS